MEARAPYILQLADKGRLELRLRLHHPSLLLCVLGKIREEGLLHRVLGGKREEGHLHLFEGEASVGELQQGRSIGTV